MIEISEIYQAPQGEGRFIGRQSLFVRVHECPLTCSWCDSKFTWDKKDPEYDKYESYSASGLAQKILDEPVGAMAIIFTGGEPMLYQRELPEVIDLVRAKYDVPIEIETSGIFTPSFDMVKRCHFNVSHKLPGAGNEKIPLDRLWNREAVHKYLWWDSDFKVVVSEADTDDSVAIYIAWLHELALEDDLSWGKNVQKRIYLMPEGRSAHEIAKRQGRIINLANEYGVCVTTRMHITADNDKRGK